MDFPTRPHPDIALLRKRNTETLRSCQLCIICARAQEADAVVERLALNTAIEGRLVDDTTKGQMFHIGTFSGMDGKEIPFYVTNTTRQGLQSFATQASSLFTLLKPDYAIHVGVCAAITGKNIECVR